MSSDGHAGVNPVERLRAKLNRMNHAERAIVWSVFRQTARLAVAEVNEESVQRLATLLSRRVDAGEPYAAVALGLKLATAHTLMKLRAAGAAARTRRSILREAFHLVRLALRAELGMRAPEEMPTVRFGLRQSAPLVEAWSDGGMRHSGSAAGVWVAASDAWPAMQGARRLAHRTALEAELEAAQLALETLRAAGVQRARLNIDSLGVLRAFQGRLALRFCIEEASLLQLAQSFAELEIRLVPRAFNQHADALATAILQAA